MLDEEVEEVEGLVMSDAGGTGSGASTVVLDRALWEEIEVGTVAVAVEGVVLCSLLALALRDGSGLGENSRIESSSSSPLERSICIGTKLDCSSSSS